MITPPTRNLELIVATARHNAIGRGGDLLFRLSPDMRHFREITTGHTVIMGRKTYLSLPKGALPDRRNIVLSRDSDFLPADAEVCPSLDAAIALTSPDSRVFIIGGGSVYREALPLVTTIHLTQIDAEAPDADTFFPDIDPRDFITTSSEPWLHDSRSGLDYRFSTLVRRLRVKKSMDDLHRIDIDTFRSQPKTPLVLILDDIRSLNNIGSIFRSADAFALESLCLCGITATPPDPAIHKTALGAENSVSWVYYPSAAAAVMALRDKGYTVAALEQVVDSVNLLDFTPDLSGSRRYAIVVGNEIEGVSQEAVNLCDFCLEIPQAGTKHSLNVAVSAALAMLPFFKSATSK